MEQTFRTLNALMRTAEQRSQLKAKLTAKEAVDPRLESFYLERTHPCSKHAQKKGRACE
jgi:hypothetical protein